MTGSIIGQNSPLRTIPSPKSKLLLVADSPDRLKKMKDGVHAADFEITGVCSVDELRAACRNHHDLVVLDVEAMQVKPMLSALRSSADNKTTMALVESSRLSQDHTLAGLLPTFRAMQCDQAQMSALLRQLSEGAARATDKRPVLL